MAQYNGFRCDLCGAVMEPEQRTKVTVRYEGHVVEGEYSMDKCPECVGEPPKPLRPLRRRKPSSQKPSQAEASTPDPRV